MSLETALAENTAALNRVAALLEQSNAGREAAVAKLTEATGAEKPATARRGRPPAAATTTAKEPDAPKNDTPAAPTIPSVDDVRAAASKFVTVEDEAERAKRKEFLKAVVDHLGCKVVDCAEDDRAKVIAWFEAKGRGEAVSFSDGEDDQAAVEDEDDIG